MNNKNIIVFEKVNSNVLIYIFFKFYLKKKNKKIYYIYSTSKLSKLIIKIYRYFGFEFIKLKFRMIDIRNENGEIYSLIIQNKELFDFEKSYFKFLNLIVSENKENNLNHYVAKSIFADFVINKNTPFRLIYLINVLNQIFDTKKAKKECIFYIVNRPCLNLYVEYAKNKEIKILSYSKYRSQIVYKLIIIKIYIKIIIKSFIRKFNIFEKLNTSNNHNYKLFCERQYQPNLILNGEKSDLLWLLNSNFLVKDTLYDCKNPKEVSKLNKFGINTSVNLFSLDFQYHKIIDYNYIYSLFLKTDIEKSNIFYHLCNYEYLYNKWLNYFKTHNIKIFLNWYKYDSSHIPITDAINSIGGISTFFQPNFEGVPFYGCKLFTDIYFCNSKLSVFIDKKTPSHVNHHVITGCPNFMITSEMIAKSKEIRRKILNNGAKQIVCVLDENSAPDERWHTGDQLQKDNYIYIIDELLKNKAIGVIFKPKFSYGLRRKLKNAYKLLEEAISTGRCYVYDQIEDKSQKFAKTTPILAALSSDLVVHSHLCAGTAAIATALHGIPTILIDRESAKNSVIYETLNKINIYNNWPDTIKAINENLFRDKKNELFGNWKDCIEYFDPFRDNRGSERIGNCLKDLIDGYKKNLDKDRIIEIALKNYVKKWGKDKII